MNNDQLEQFNPTVAELQTLKQKYQKLEINGVEDKAGYAIVNEARKDLKAKRISITKLGKDLRDDANRFAKAVIEREKELIAIIEPLEVKLQEQIISVDNVVKTPERVQRLLELGIVGDIGLIKTMNDLSFNKYFNEMHTNHLNKKAEELRLQELELNRKRELAAVEQRARLLAEQVAEKERQDLEARNLADRLELKRVEDAKNVEIAKLKYEAEQKELVVKKAEQDKAQAEKIAIEAKKRVLKNKDYQDWLVINNVTNKDIVKTELGIVKIYRIIAERRFDEDI